MGRYVILILFLSGTFMACRPDTDVSDPVYDPVISARAAHDLIDQSDVIFLHVGRDADDFADGHIEGARFFALSAFTEERDGIPFELPPTDYLGQVFEKHGIDEDSRIIIYSDPSLGDIETLAAARAFFTLEALGHTYVQMIDGGLNAWRAEGLELVTDASAPAPSSYVQASDPQDLIVTADHVAAHLDDAGVMLIDARPPDEYSGETPGQDIERPGHIPGAYNLFWKDFLQEDGTLKPTIDLEEIWAATGITPDHDVVVYCRTGMQASYAYLVARHLGMTPLMYDGSYIDWSNNTDYPISTN